MTAMLGALRLNGAAMNALYFSVSLVQLLLLSCFAGVVFGLISIWFNLCVLVLLFLRKGGILDPRIIFSVFYCMYQTWFPLSVIVGADNVFQVIDYRALALSLFYSFVGLVS